MEKNGIQTKICRMVKKLKGKLEMTFQLKLIIGTKMKSSKNKGVINKLNLKKLLNWHNFEKLPGKVGRDIYNVSTTHIEFFKKVI